jgi:hypothetical protein
MTFFDATNDVAWYLQSGISRPLMDHANCTSPTLGCICKAKAAGIALLQAQDDYNWCRASEEAAHKELPNFSVLQPFTPKLQVFLREQPVSRVIYNTGYRYNGTHVNGWLLSDKWHRAETWTRGCRN